MDRCMQCPLYQLDDTGICPACGGTLNLHISGVSMAWHCKSCAWGIATTAQKLCFWDRGKYPIADYGKIDECKYAELNTFQ